MEEITTHQTCDIVKVIVIQRFLRHKFKKVSLFDYTTEGTQLHYIAKVFENSPNKWLSKPDIEGAWVIDYMFSELSDDDEIKMTKKDMRILWQKKQPGDIQRTLKTVYAKYKKMGLKKKNWHRHNLQQRIEAGYMNVRLTTPLYCWNPICTYKTEILIHPVCRNIFPTSSQREEFIESKDFKCEMCFANKKNTETIRLGVDHWLAHSVYGEDSDNKELAVLLCEKCNNIKKDRDSSYIPLTYKDDLKLIRRWYKKELEMSKIVLPNKTEHDLKMRKENISKIKEAWPDPDDDMSFLDELL